MRAPKSESAEFEKHPEGWVTAVCSRVIDKGTHFNEVKQKYQRKLMLFFESDKLLQSGDYKGEPFILVDVFNYSMYQNSHLCKFIEDWRGKRFLTQSDADKFDFSKLIGQSAYINVVHNGAYVNIQTIGPVPADRAAPTIQGKTVLIDQDDLDMTEVNKLSDKLREQVLSSEEQKSKQELDDNGMPVQSDGQNPPGADDDDIPF